jgi:hypothetical protein
MAHKVTSSDVLERMHLTPDQLNIPCSFKHCTEVAAVLLKWEPLAPWIGLNEADITTVQQDHRGDYRSQCSAALSKWRHKFGCRATFLRLAEGMEKTGDLERVEELCRVFSTLSHADTSLAMTAASTLAVVPIGEPLGLLGV